MNFEQDKLKDKCGVFGIYSKNPTTVAHYTYYGLYALQHRGQESSGICVCKDGKLINEKGMGIVPDVFDDEKLNEMTGKSAIGHVRYATTGETSLINAQPLVSNFDFGDMAIAHNGNLVNTDVLRELLEDSGSKFETSIDTEVILELIGKKAKRGLEKALIDTIQAVKGSYGIVMLTSEMLIGIRDPYGIRPLCLGKMDDAYVLASESCALDAIGAELIRDVDPGEVIIVDDSGMRSIKLNERTITKTCAFEYIYFARPDSIMDNTSIYEARVRGGELLYRDAPAEADVVIGVPDSGLPAAVGYAKASGIPYALGIVKNKYVARTFISPTQEIRERAVSVKLNALKCIVAGKRVVLIDDSIVRGTTSKRLIDIMKKAGAKEVHFRSASPTVKYPCYFGIDTPYRSELIGANMNLDEINDYIGSDSVGYLNTESLVEALGGEEKFCLGCFEGQYPISAPMEKTTIEVRGE